jgi:MtrB/PioB family decaheme-associated outer membrane protein
MKASAALQLVAAAFAVVGLATPAVAQTSVFGLNVEGEAEAGFRAFIDRPTKGERAKFEEYRDLPQRPFLDSFHLRLFRPDESYSFEFDGSKWGQQDQQFSLRTGRLGLWEFGFDWDQMRHIFSTNARMLATETSRGVFTLPSGLARALPGDGPRYNSARELDEISTRWDTARILFKLTPTPDLELKAEYTRINKDGDRPMGVPFGFTFMEVLEPIEQTIHDFRLQTTIAREQWQLQFGYTLSIFQNALSALTTDNPVQATDTATRSASGTMSLPPDNTAHTFSLAGGVNLPWWRTRVTSNFSYSLRLQNDDFLPHTRNPLILASGGNDLVLPQRNLDGNVQVFLYNLNVTSRPLPPLTLSLKYRLYDYKDESDVITFASTVETDSNAPNAEDVRPGRWSYRRQNTDVDARWRIVQPVALTLGAGWERWDRNEHREVAESDELFGKLALDVTPFDWLLARLKYVPSFRRINHYITHAHAEHTVLEDTGTLNVAGQSPFLRKLDESDRDRHRVDFLLQLTPTDTFSVGPTFGYRYDDFVNSRFGLQAEKSWSAGMDANWTPLERLSLSGGYVHERISQKQRSRSRAPGVDFADFDWVSDNTDTVDTYSFRASVVLIPKVLEWNTAANYSYALGRVETTNPRTPVSGTAAQRATATATPWPAFEDSLVRIESALKFHFWKVWSAKLGYVFEEFEKHDFRTDTLNPFNPGSNSIYLGNDLKDYTAHMVLVTIGYTFK